MKNIQFKKIFYKVKNFLRYYYYDKYEYDYVIYDETHGKPKKKILLITRSILSFIIRFVMGLINFILDILNKLHISNSDQLTYYTYGKNHHYYSILDEEISKK
ncbi:hypothetical protein ZICARI_234 [Candidatus Zinderia insecticola CARI]|uniref:Uncharacterized protein n=1 Tax=Zinderia insecticola (strain CARI) TaxID=871271 RepID=E4PYU3_ZINIC|nr:hypothetical protein ZICARI_234 [Candidatus Zinderia insecticola CARI]